MKSGTSQIVRNGKIIDVFEISNLVNKEELAALRDEMHQNDHVIEKSVEQKISDGNKFRWQTYIAAISAIAAVISVILTFTGHK